MTDLEYLDRAEQLLLAVEQCCDRINDETDADIDAFLAAWTDLRTRARVNRASNRVRVA